MKLSPCNVTDFQLHAFLPQCRFPPRTSRPCFPPRRSSVSSAVCKAVDTGVAAAAAAIQSGSEKEKTGISADRLRLGSLTEDGLSYKEKFIVRCYEVGINKTATVETIANLLQVLLCCFLRYLSSL